MGLRATVIKKYEVEFGNTGGFNYGTDGLAAIIRTFCTSNYFGDEDVCPDSGAVWEVDKEEFRQMLDDIRQMTHEELVSRIREENYYEDEWSKDEIVRVFEGFLSETPDEYDIVRFAWL